MMPRVERVSHLRMPARFLLAACILAVSCLLAACGGQTSSTASPSEQVEETEPEKVAADAGGELEIRHDREPIDNHFPGFPEAKELEWVAYGLYDDRDPGPTVYGMEVLATLEEGELDRFLGDAELSPVDKWPEAIGEARLLPSRLASMDDWQQVLDVQAILPAKGPEDIHASVILVNEEESILCVYGTGGN